MLGKQQSKDASATSSLAWLQNSWELTSQFWKPRELKTAERCMVVVVAAAVVDNETLVLRCCNVFMWFCACLA